MPQDLLLKRAFLEFVKEIGQSVASEVGKIIDGFFVSFYLGPLKMGILIG